MDSHYGPDTEHPKKRRRREIARSPVTARLVFDDQTAEETALVSEDIWEEIGQEEVVSLGRDNHDKSTGVVFIALTPSTPLYHEIKDLHWTLAPAQKLATSQHDGQTGQRRCIRISSRASACQSLLKTLIAIDSHRHGSHLPKQLEVRVTAVKALHLDTVYVTVEKGLLDKVDDIQNRFGGGFQHTRAKLERKPSEQNGSVVSPFVTTEDRLTTLVRKGLSNLAVIHSSDVFPLPLPSHPITHVRPPPAIVIASEPVSQGVVSPKTKVVLVQAGSSQEKALKRLTQAVPIIEESIEDTAEDTSNDQFFSAAEDRPNGTASELDHSTDEEMATSDESSKEASDEDSDSMDDMISLAAPGLPPQPAGTLSAMTAATPRPGGRRTGSHTPGSVYSSFTSATARAGSRPGKVFRTEALLKRLPREMLHPRPSPEDDDQSFVLVDTTNLAKIGCFSGDWVRIEVARNISNGAFQSSALSRLAGDAEDGSNWRVVRIFGLSGLPNDKPRYVVDRTGQRRSSFSQKQRLPSLTPALYLSPILLTNLENAQFVKVGALPKPQRYEDKAPYSHKLPTPIRGPPIAREVNMVMISTPTTTSNELQSVLFASLKQHFEATKRVVKQGDLIGVAVDGELGKTTARSAPNEASSGEDEVLSQLNGKGRLNERQLDLAWFSVQYVDAETNPEEDAPAQELWGGTALTDASVTRLSQAGKLNQPVPHLVSLWTKYWLGLRQIVKSSTTHHDIVVTTNDLPISSKLPLEQRLSDLVSAATSVRAVNLGLPPLAILLHSTQRLVGKTYTATSACSEVGVHTFVMSCHDLLSENANTTGGGDVKTEALLQMRAERALSSGAQQTALLMRHIDVLTADRMIPTLEDIISQSRVFIATTTKIDDISAGIRSLFTHELEVSAPDEKAREIILRNAALSTGLPMSPNINFKSLALQTAALVAGDLADVINRAAIARSTRLLELADKESCDLTDIAVSGGQSTTHLLPSDFATAISAARSTFSDAIGAPKIPTVTWADVGGLASQKDAIMETISLPLTRPELFANGIRKRSGILFYGPPGTGKTLLAKAIATEFSLNFFSVKGPELLNMYIGESEANVRRVFQRARDARPCVVFFDELDSVAPKRGNQGDSGGVMDRIVSQLLAELDGMSSGNSSSDGKDSSANAGGGVFVIGATNRPDLLDPALLRPGRFDKMLYLGVADSHDQQVTILKALTRKFTLSPEVDLTRVVEKLPFTYTGADLYALCSDAMLKAITRKTKLVDENVAEISRIRGHEVTTGYFFDHLATEEDTRVIVNEEDFELAQKELVGSVSAKELEHFERIRNLFEEQDISAGNKEAKEKDKGKPTEVALPIRQNTQIFTPTQQQSKPDNAQQNQNHAHAHTAAKGRPKQQRHPSSQQSAKTERHDFASSRTNSTSNIGNPDSDADVDDDSDVYGLNTVGQVNDVTEAPNEYGRTRSKGKGKARVDMENLMHSESDNGFVRGLGSGNGNGNGFEDVDGDDDEDLYD